METPSTKKEKVIIIPRPPRSANAETAQDEVTETVEAEEVENPSAPLNPVASGAEPRNNPAGGPAASGACVAEEK